MGNMQAGESGAMLRRYLVGSEGSLLFGQVLILDGAVWGIYHNRPIVAKQVNFIAVGELENRFRRDKRKICHFGQQSG